MQTLYALKDKEKNLVRWLLLIVCVIFGMLYLNGAFASWWASWGPLTDYPSAWVQQAIKRLCVAIAFLFTGPMIFLLLKNGYKFKNSFYKYVWLFVIILSITYPYIREFFLIDKCLDSGGAWNEEYFVCNR
jgi:hypothetical protein